MYSYIPCIWESHFPVFFWSSLVLCHFQTSLTTIFTFQMRAVTKSFYFIIRNLTNPFFCVCKTFMGALKTNDNIIHLNTHQKPQSKLLYRRKVKGSINYFQTSHRYDRSFFCYFSPMKYFTNY